MSVTYDLTEFGKVLGVGRTTMHKLRRQGKLLDPLPFSPENHPRWSAEEVARWIAARTPDAQTWREMNADKQPTATA